MAKISNNDIRNINEDWGLDPRTNLPYSGRAVQKFIKDTFNDKIGASYFDGDIAMMYYFRTEEDKEKWLNKRDASLVVSSMPFSDKINAIQIINKTTGVSKDGIIYFTTNSEIANIIFSFKSIEKTLTGSDETELLEDFYVSIDIDSGNVGNYVGVADRAYVKNSNDFILNIKNYLIVGDAGNRIKITVEGADSKASKTEIITAKLTSLYLKEFNFDWTIPFIEGIPYNLGGFQIGGNLNKKLIVNITKEGYNDKVEIDASNSSPDRPFYFENFPFPTMGSGVYNFNIHVDANGIESEYLNYNIICIRQEDKDKVSFVAINNSINTIINGVNNSVFDYCLYDKNLSYASFKPIVTNSLITNNEVTTIDKPHDIDGIQTRKKYTYTKRFNVKVESDNTKIESIITFGNVQKVILNIDNSQNYPAVYGASLEIDPNERSNNNDDRNHIINESTGTYIENSNFTNISWSDGIDGWTEDNDQRKCLKLLAGSNVNINYKPLRYINSAEGKTIELVYKVSNVSDYHDPIITICNDRVSEDFVGIKIKPKNVLVQSTILKDNKNFRDYNLEDETVIHLIISITYNYRINYGNMVHIYVNGNKCRAFSFENNDSFTNLGNIILGNNTSDLCLYKLRVYEHGFGKLNVINNYLNTIFTIDKTEKAIANVTKMYNRIYSPVDNDLTVNYEKCKIEGFNTMVIEMLSNKNELPSLNNKEENLKCNLEITINNIIEGDLDEELKSLFDGSTKIENQVIEGQGTTAMTYNRWNFRWNLDSNYNKRRITAKKNVASSMHSHKMGATRLFNYLHKECVGTNEANSKVAVCQYPVYGFQKIKRDNGEYDYKFIGLYTIGADKKDKVTFGYNKFKDTLIHMEGPDNNVKVVGFDYPWSEVYYDPTKDVESICINKQGAVSKGWEVGAAGPYETTPYKIINEEGIEVVTDDRKEIMTLLNNEFKDAYNVIHHNSTFILGTNVSINTINNDIESWQSKKTEDGKYTYREYEFWIKENNKFNLYYFNEETRLYSKVIKDNSNGIKYLEMLEDLGYKSDNIDYISLAISKLINVGELESSYEEIDITSWDNLFDINKVFIEARKQRFADTWGNYWNVNDTIFHYCYVVLIGATDNFKKNTYPYKFKPISEGGKWRWRQDDLDTIFDVNNLGFSDKSYSILVDDNIYVGELSRIWVLIRETQQSAIKNMMLSIFNAMKNKSAEVGFSSVGIEGLINCIKYYFWDLAQEYFPQSAYNADAEWTYEDILISNNPNYILQNTPPLQQLLGAHYDAEKDWVRMRMLFMASYYNYGPFASDDASLGQIAFRSNGPHVYSITPAVDLNPTIVSGDSGAFSPKTRIKAGNTAIIGPIGEADGDTYVFIQGADWLSSIGNLHTLKLDDQNTKFIVKSKRLKKLLLGNEDASIVTNNITSLEINECPSLEYLDARNVSFLSATVDLTKAPRLKTALFGGTSVRSISIPDGNRIEHLQISDTITSLFLKKSPFLTTFEYGNLSNVVSLNIQNCDNLDILQIFKDAYTTPNSQLKYIKLEGINSTTTFDILEILNEMVEAKDESGNRKYFGIDDKEQNTDGLPTLKGVINITGNAYQDIIDNLISLYGNDLIINVTGSYYVRFEDPAFNQIVADTYGNGIGTTQEQLDKVTTLFSMYSNNTVFTLNDLYKIRNLTTIGPNVLSKMGELTSVNIPLSVEKMEISSVTNNTKLERIVISSNKITELSNFLGESELSLEYLVIPDSVINCSFGNNNKIQKLFLGSSLKSISNSAYNKSYSSDLYIKNLKQWFEMSISNMVGSTTTLYLGQIEAVRDPNKGNQIDHYLWDKLEGTGDYEGQGTRIKVTLPMINEALKEVTEIKDYACTNMTQLEGDLVIPESVTSIGGSSFQACSNINSIKIEGDITDIDNYAFRDMGNIESLKINRVDYINLYGFLNTTTQNVYVNSLQDWLNIKFGDQSSNPMYKGSNLYINNVLATDITINADAIGDFSFMNCKSLERLTLNSVTSIGDYAFYGCTGLTSVTIPNSVTSIGNSVFKNCSNLTGKLFILSSIKNLGNDCFAGTGLTEVVVEEGFTAFSYRHFEGCSSLKVVDLPSTLTTMGTNTFKKCPSLTTIIIRATTPPQFSSWGYQTNPFIYVPDESVEAYKIAEGWSAHAYRIKPLSEIEGFNLLPQSGNVSKVTTLKATYDAIEVTPEYTIEGTAAILDGNILTFNEIGEVTVTATYNSESVSRTYSWDGSLVTIENGVELNGAGITTSNSTMSTVGFVSCNPSTQIRWGVTGGTLGNLCEYREDDTFVDYWVGSQNPRTISVSANSTKVKASFSTAHLANAYIYDVTNSEYLWKGDNVES